MSIVFDSKNYCFQVLIHPFLMYHPRVSIRITRFWQGLISKMYCFVIWARPDDPPD